MIYVSDKAKTRVINLMEEKQFSAEPGATDADKFVDSHPFVEGSSTTND